MSEDTDITIPPKALEAAAKELTMALVLAVDEDCRACALTDDERMEVARAACLAMIRNWEGMKLNPSWELRTHKRSVEIILPLSEPPKLDRKAAVAERLFGDD